jgi:hypothetical protein
MDTVKNQIIINDEVIISYYRENPNIDFIAMNHIIIDILKNLSSNLSATINSTVNTKILSIVSEIDKNVSLMKSDILLKLHETKREYMDDLKAVLYTNNLSNNEKIFTIIERNNEHLLSKIKTTIEDIIPKSQENCYTQIEGCVKNSFYAISQDTKNLLEIIKTNKDENLMQKYIETIDTHITNMFSAVQQPIFNSLKSSEERTNNGIQQIKDSMSLQQKIQETLRSEMSEFLNKYKNNSQFKGNVAEVELQSMLLSIMPSDEIIRVSSDTATCDFRVNRKDTSKPSIIFESKNYNRSISTVEVKKFERDVHLQNVHGIFISQESPITFKDNFQIDIINGLIHVYIPNANYEVEKIKIAIDIIDNLSHKLNILSKQSDDEYSLTKEELDEITEEYKIFAIQKTQMLETIKTVHKQLVDRLEEIQFPKIKKFLTRLGCVENDNDFKCQLCNNWAGKNKASLAAHIRNCKHNTKNKKNEFLTLSIEDNNLVGEFIESTTSVEQPSAEQPSIELPIVDTSELDKLTTNKKKKKKA